MSDRSSTTSVPAGQGGKASGHSPGEGLPESVVDLLLEAQFSRLKSELLAALKPEPVEPLERPMFGELLAEWLVSIASKRVQPANEQRLARHLRGLYLEDETTLTAAMVEEYLAGLPLAPSTRNKARGVGRLALDRARASRRWREVNPFTLAPRAKEPSRKYETLTEAELVAVQEQLRPDRRRMFRLHLHLGFRPGELLALRKSDVDFQAGTILVHRSHGRSATKTGKDRVLPILASIAQDLWEAMQESGSELVFSNADGQQWRHDTKLTRVIRTAMRDAGVGITDVTYKCRRCGSAQHLPPPVSENVCTKCNVLRWPVPTVRPFRWYDLRHAAARCHRRAGADPLAIATVLGHSTRGATTTDRVYTHFEVADLRRELSKWALPRTTMTKMIDTLKRDVTI